MSTSPLTAKTICPTPLRVAKVYPRTSHFCGLRNYLATFVASFCTRQLEHPAWSLDKVQRLLLDLPDLNKDVIGIISETKGKPRHPQKMALVSFHESEEPRRGA
jgi:hypothetical protein